MSTVRFPEAGVSASIRWSIYAGIYMFACGTVVALTLSDMLAVLAEVIGLPGGYWAVIVAGPSLAIGAGIWWTIVERRGRYAYLLGAAVGLLTALATGILWTAQFVRVWGFEMANVPIVTFLIAFVLGVTAATGAVAALPLIYARRRLNSESEDG